MDIKSVVKIEFNTVICEILARYYYTYSGKSLFTSGSTVKFTVVNQMMLHLN